MKQQIKIYIVTAIVFGSICTLASGLHVSQAEALRVIQVMGVVK